MAEETFDIVYKTDATGARPSIDYLKNATISLGQFASDSAEQLRKLGGAATASSKNLGSLGKAIDGLTSRRAALVDLVLPFEFLDTALHSVRQSLAGANADLRDFAARSRDVGRVTFAMTGLADAGVRAKDNVAGASAEVVKFGGHTTHVEMMKSSMVGFQRSAYGAKKNVEETGVAVVNLASQTEGLKKTGPTWSRLTSGAKGFRGEVEKTTPSAGLLNTSMLAMGARIAMFGALRDAVKDLGKAFTDAREKADSWGRGNLALRDEYRELANLQGKPDTDDSVVAGALRFRVATGLDDHAANDALRRFEGELPGAVGKGNITGDATSGVAGDFLREATRTGLRVGMSGATSGLLAAKLAMTDKVPDADTGLGRFQTVVDLLNRGSGDLTPLVQSLMNTAGGHVGKGMPFKNLPQLAAAIEVSSENATPAMAGTRVRQANAGLNRLRAGDGLAQMSDEDQKKLTPRQLAKLKGTGVALGLKQDDFAGNIEKLGAHLDGKKDWDAELTAMGLKNQTERRSLIQFVTNRKRLRTETDAADKGIDPAEAKALNDKFFKGDAAQMRIAKAKNDAAEFVRARGNEKLQVARKAAEERLKTRFELDTPASNFDEAMGDNPVTRAASAAAMKAVGRTPTVDVLPLGLGGKPTRQLKIDKEAYDTAKSEARKVGLDPDKFVANRVPDDAPFEERFNALASEVQNRGGNPFGSGGGQTDALLQQLIQVAKKGNELQAQALKAAAQPGFLPAGQAINNTLAGAFGGFGMPLFDPTRAQP